MLQTRQPRQMAVYSAYAVAGGSIAITLILRHFGITFAVAANTLLSWDYGNAIAALVAVGGYLLENMSTRKAQRQEKQMERVEAQSHELLVPVTVQFQGLWILAVHSFVDKQSEQFIDKPEHKETKRRYEMMSDTTLRKASMFERPFMLNSSLTSPMLMDIMTVPDTMCWRIASKTELPKFLHDEIAKSDRESDLWNDYEMFIRHTFLPLVTNIADIVHEHGHLMEPVPASRLREMYGKESNGYGMRWEISPRSFFYSFWLTYSMSWNELIAKWDDGNKKDIRPYVNFPCGLMPFNVEAQSIVAKVEQELIGMSQMHGHGDRKDSADMASTPSKHLGEKFGSRRSCDVANK